MLPPYAYWIILSAVIAFAFARGRFDERAAAIICVLATIGTVVARSMQSNDYQAIEYGVLLVDGLTLAAFVAIALITRRFWPLWVAGFQLTSTFSHALKLLHPDLVPQVYAVAERFWVYPIFLAIVVGTWRSHRRLVADTMAGPSRAHPL